MGWESGIGYWGLGIKMFGELDGCLVGYINRKIGWVWLQWIAHARFGFYIVTYMYIICGQVGFLG